jgi:HK97 family phage major capsid protein
MSEEKIMELGDQINRRFKGLEDEIGTLKSASKPVSHQSHSTVLDAVRENWPQIDAYNTKKATSASFELKTLISESAVGSATSGVLNPMRVPGIVPGAAYPSPVRGLLPVFQTANNAVDFVKENVLTNAASPQTEGNAKGESAITFTTANALVQTIATWIPATRQVMADMEGLAQYIQTRLTYALGRIEEYELLFGDNTGVHLNGLATQATAYTTGYNQVGDTSLDKLRHAILQAEVAGYPPDGIIVHPEGWHEIELIKNAASNIGNYVVGDPSGMQLGKSIWGIPVVSTTSMVNGKFLVGSFRMGAAIYQREGLQVDISTEHSTYFTENKVAVRIEERLTLVVFRPASFIYGAF